MNIILKTKLKVLTKKLSRGFITVLVGLIFIVAILIIKYRPVYEVTLQGEKIGTIQNKETFTNLINERIINIEERNIANVSLKNELSYSLKLQNRKINTNEEEIIEKIKQDNTTTIYKYYEIALNGEIKTLVDTMEEAESIINQIKEEFTGDELELDLQINEKYTENYNDINLESIEVASTSVENAAQEIKEEKEREDALAVINDVKISVLPIKGTITSRYGASSSIRKSTHTGLDIATSSGTPIKATASGTVIFAQYSGSYGNLVKIDHGNGVETWYGHCSKFNTKVGTKVNAGDVIAYVGSTGNSTGPHLHFEIRINGNTVNPQNYVY